MPLTAAREHQHVNILALQALWRLWLEAADEGKLHLGILTGRAKRFGLPQRDDLSFVVLEKPL